MKFDDETSNRRSGGDGGKGYTLNRCNDGVVQVWDERREAARVNGFNGWSAVEREWAACSSSKSRVARRRLDDASNADSQAFAGEGQCRAQPYPCDGEDALQQIAANIMVNSRRIKAVS